VHAGCGAGVSWDVSTQSYSSHGSDGTQDVSSRSVQHSNDGQDWDDTQTSHTNPDGSSHTHQESNYTDREGNGCNSDGEPSSGHRTEDDDEDSKGNRKQHIEEIIEKDGKCEKRVRDREWDRKGNLIKDTGWITTEVPCSTYTLEVHMEGNVDLEDLHAKYGPNTGKIYLEKKDEAYVGHYEAAWDFEATSSDCEGFGTYPVTFNVTATKSEGDQLDLDFSVESSMGVMGVFSCPDAGGAINRPPVTGTLTFMLPAEDGASKVYSLPGGVGANLAITFTLRRTHPQ